MKVLKKRDKFLSNYEVLEHLKELKSLYNWTFEDENQSMKKQKKRSLACGIELEVVTKQILSYLDKTPCSAIQSNESFKELLLFLNKFDLMKVEKLQIVNSLPRSMVNLYAIVEECDQRFDEDTCDSILETINRLFPVEENAEANEEKTNGIEEDQEDEEEEEEVEG
ncbi:uncharacterized protein PRCAT00000358001 [Priceomyces carsonii]|uniref:uncharacterized protein n=1 Tax=Priceomyces carsonii TaxID=28549 RepID=UPI002EDBB5CB|nr:unnamed protein product [Priceomyces carsonii]